MARPKSSSARYGLASKVFEIAFACFSGSSFHILLTGFDLRAYIVSGERIDVSPLGSYDDWSRRIREPLVWLGCADPVKTMDRVRQDDPARLSLAAVVQQWAKHLDPEKRYRALKIVEYATSKRFTISGDGARARRERADFHTALLGVAGDGGFINVKRLGRYLAANKNKVIDCMRIEEAGSHAGSLYWILRKTGG
jgi:putative DNA primase/helicase